MSHLSHFAFKLAIEGPRLSYLDKELENPYNAH